MICWLAVTQKIPVTGKLATSRDVGSSDDEQNVTTDVEVPSMMMSDRQVRDKYRLVPSTRLTVSFMCFLLLFETYLLRVNISMALVCMVRTRRTFQNESVVMVGNRDNVSIDLAQADKSDSLTTTFSYRDDIEQHNGAQAKLNNSVVTTLTSEVGQQMFVIGLDLCKQC